MAWIGEVGNLVQIKCPSRMRVSDRYDVAVETTLAGTEKAFLPPLAPSREWELDLAAGTPSSLAVIQSLLAGAYGTGPWWFIDPWAERTNILSRNRSMVGATGNAFYNKSVATPTTMNVPGMGRVPALLINPGQEIRLAHSTPVVPGRQVTLSAWVTGSAPATVKAQFLGPTGSWVNATSVPATLTSTPQRLHVTGTPTVGATTVDLRITSSTSCVVALPAVTWTSEITDYLPGQGAPQVIATGSTLDVLRAAPTSRLASASVVFRELGSPNA